MIFGYIQFKWLGPLWIKAFHLRFWVGMWVCCYSKNEARYEWQISFHNSLLAPLHRQKDTGKRWEVWHVCIVPSSDGIDINNAYQIMALLPSKLSVCSEYCECVRLCGVIDKKLPYLFILHIRIDVRASIDIDKIVVYPNLSLFCCWWIPMRLSLYSHLLFCQCNRFVNMWPLLNNKQPLNRYWPFYVWFYQFDARIM